MTHEDGTDSVWECCGAWECVCAIVSASDPVEIALGKAWSGLAIQQPSSVFAAESVKAFAQPLRELHKPLAYTDKRRCCLTCNTTDGRPQVWPCATAVLIYPTNELTQEN